MKNILKSLVVVGLVSAAGIVQANILGDAFHTTGNVVKGTVNTAVGVPRDLAEGEGLNVIPNTINRGVNTAGGAVYDTGRTVTNPFNDNENPVENEDLRYTDNGPLLDREDYSDDVE